MPYITDERRKALDTGSAQPQNAGELNYQICELLTAYIAEKGLRYQTLNDILGVLEAVKQELYRRLVGPYEDKKITDNGDISLFSNQP